MIRLQLMLPLTRLLGTKELAVEVDRGPLKAVLEHAAARDARFRTALLDQDGNLSGEYSCLVNGRRHNVTDLDGVEVDEGDEIVILMPLAGGAPSPLPAVLVAGCPSPPEADESPWRGRGEGDGGGGLGNCHGERE